MGAVYAAIGIVAARVAFLGSRDRVAGMPGALRFISLQPHGQLILWGIVSGLTAFAIWQLAEAANPRRSAFQRLGRAAAGVGYGALAWTGVRFLIRVRKGTAPTHRAVLEWLLSQPWGAAALTGVAVIVLVGAVQQIVQAVSGRLRERFLGRVMGPRASSIALRIARVGLAARGVVFGIVGYFLIRTASERDASQFREIGGALRALSKTPAGPALMGVVALGLVAYAVYLWTLALFRRA
jgi:hypothetical protein